jgi:hypothetical protein
MNDALMIGIVLTLVFGAVVFYLYNRLSMTERKIGLFEGVLTDLKIMMDAAPFSSDAAPYSMQQNSYEFEPTPEYLNAISGPIPLQKGEVDEMIPENEYEQAMNGATNQDVAGPTPYRNLQIDELGPSTAGLAAINVTKLSPDLDSLTVKELQAIAKDNSISVPAGTRRKDLIELLKKAPLATNTESVTGTALVPQMDAPQGLQGSLLASFDGPAASTEGAAL